MQFVTKLRLFNDLCVLYLCFCCYFFSQKTNEPITCMALESEAPPLILLQVTVSYWTATGHISCPQRH